jgi:hypothetical protein
MIPAVLLEAKFFVKIFGIYGKMHPQSKLETVDDLAQKLGGEDELLDPIRKFPKRILAVLNQSMPEDERGRLALTYANLNVFITRGNVSLHPHYDSDYLTLVTTLKGDFTVILEKTDRGIKEIHPRMRLGDSVLITGNARGLDTPVFLPGLRATYHTAPEIQNNRILLITRFKLK